MRQKKGFFGVESKRCKKCLSEKKTDDFYPVTNKNGELVRHRAVCKTCFIKDIKTNYNYNDKVKVYRAKWREKNPEKVKRYRDNFIRKHPDYFQKYNKQAWVRAKNSRQNIDYSP